MDDNEFAYTSAGPIVVNNTGSNLAKLVLRYNDFSHGTATIHTLTVTPGTIVRRGNYGTRAFLSENVGLYSAQPGAVASFTVAHGLLTTPTSVVVTPQNTNARAVSPQPNVTVDATNITFNFSAALSAATTYAWFWNAVV